MNIKKEELFAKLDWLICLQFEVLMGQQCFYDVNAGQGNTSMAKSR